MHVNYAKRKQDHTIAALEYALRLDITPMLLEIQYPSITSVPASYYAIDRGRAMPIPKRDTVPGSLLKLIYLPNRETVFQWM
jgi:hypothetical protein